MFPFTLTQVCCLTFIWAAPVSEQGGRGGPGIGSMERERGNMQVVEKEDIGVGEFRGRVRRSPLPFRRFVLHILKFE